MEGCRIGRESRMGEHGGPAVKQSCRDCLPEQWCGLSCPVLRQEAEEGACFLAPPSSGFDPQDDEATAAATGELWIDPLFVAASVVQCRSCISAMAMSGLAFQVRGETRVASTAIWHPPHKGKPFAMTSIRRSSRVWTLGMFKSATRVWVVTLAPASRQMRAAARSSGPPRLRNSPDCAQADRWSPSVSRVQRHQQVLVDRERGRRSLRSISKRKCSEE